MPTTDENLHRRHKKLKVDFCWSDLPADLLRTISKKLHDICDFVRFRAICKNWRAVTSIFDLPPQIPWVIEESSDIDKKGYIRFYSLLSDKIYTINCPQSFINELLPTNGMELLSSHGYLYPFHDFSIPEKYYLLNPLIKHQVAFQFDECSDRDLICMSPGLFGDGDYVVFRNEETLMIEFYQPQKSMRNYIEGPNCDHIYIKACNPRWGQACCKGMHFMHNTRRRKTEVFDIASGSFFEIPSHETSYYVKNVYFVESRENILKIVMKRHTILESDGSDQLIFDIYRLDVGDINQYRWTKIDGIGDQILFLDWLSCSFGISVPSNQSTEFMRNNIYYMKSDGIYKYDINSRRSQIISCRFNHFETWFVPNLVALPSVS